jgi:hypothetical protein
MRTTTNAAKATTTTIEIDADVVAKFRQCLHVISYDGTVEGFIVEMLKDLMCPQSGVLQDMIRPADEHRSEAIEVELARIY